jgi:small subunit ribosomal protein S11
MVVIDPKKIFKIKRSNFVFLFRKIPRFSWAIIKYSINPWASKAANIELKLLKSFKRASLKKNSLEIKTGESKLTTAALNKRIGKQYRRNVKKLQKFKRRLFHPVFLIFSLVHRCSLDNLLLLYETLSKPLCPLASQFFASIVEKEIAILTIRENIREVVSDLRDRGIDNFDQVSDLFEKILLESMKGRLNKRLFSSNLNPLLSNDYTVHLIFTGNNFYALLKMADGKVLLRKTSGLCGFKKGTRSTMYSTLSISREIGLELKSREITNINLILSGFSSKRPSIIKSLITTGDLVIKNIIEKTPVPHNGVRPKKKLRG